MSTYRIPTVHLNGTSREALLTANYTALEACRTALEALQACAPNARDFYPQGENAYREASTEHNLRAASLKKIAEEIFAIIEGIEDQGKQPR